MSITTDLNFNNTLSNNSNIIFVNSNLDNYQSLISDVENADVILLDYARHGVEQVTEALANYTEVNSIHIVSHGQTGTLQIGSTDLNADNLDNYAADLQSWSESLTDNGDILLYGCKIGAETAGVDFLTNFSQLTSADVAASDDLTGSEYLGGDWDLEITIGEIEADIIDANIDTYESVLPIYDGSEYQLTESLSWEQAQAQAKSLGGNLVVINDAAEQKWLNETFGTKEKLWIGLTDSDLEGDFRWVNGETSGYRNWAVGEPNDHKFNGAFPAGEDYTLMNWNISGQWNDMPNNYKGTFRGIIEIEGESKLNSVVEYDNFVDVSQLTLNGSATQIQDALRLTSAQKAQAGNVFFNKPIRVTDDTSFSTEFQFQISGGTDGADGFTFILQNDRQGDNALGDDGGGVGYRDLEQSIAIEFDTYKGVGDPNNNHISILRDGNTSNALINADSIFDLNGGEILNAWIDYEGSSDVLEVYLSDTTVKPETSLLSSNIDLTSVVGDRAFFGFGAATGGQVNNHDILNWEVKSNSKLVTTVDNKAELTSIVDYNSFADVSRLKLNGSAIQVEDALRLTSAQKAQAGNVFFDEPIRVTDDTSFSTEFQFQISGGTDGADGFTFILQNDRQGDNALGDDGGGVGYRDLKQSIAIEFDTYKGGGDPNNNHISILRDGNTSNALINADSIFDLNGGEILNAWIDYEGSSDVLEVYLSDTTVKPETAILSTTVDLIDILGDRARIGFGAGTGGKANNHDILNWSFASSEKLAPEGDFSESIDWNSVAIHAGLTPDGKVLTYGLDANFGSPDSQRNTKFIIWDPEQGTDDSAFDILNMSHSIDSAFCSGMILLPDGQMLIAGGSIQGDRNAGNDLVHLYDYCTGEIKMLMEDSDLQEARWYPTMTTLTDGRILLQGGRDAVKENGVYTPEIYTAGQGSSLLNGATSSEIYGNNGARWWYPRSWVAPNGKVFGLTNNVMYYLDPEGEGNITQSNMFAGENRGISSTAVMYDRGKILQLGGNRQSTQATIIDINNEIPVLSSAGTTNYARAWGDSTVLPDGTVFVSGGSIRNNVVEQVAYAAEIWDPKTNTWTVVDSAAVPRLYHSTSLLLPDATVLTAGGTTNGLDSEALTGEIYRPAYLYDDEGNLAQRPTLSSESSLIDWGESMTATVGSGQKIDRVSLVSFGAVTHSFNMGQRFLELDFSQSGDRLTIETPESANVAPPGFYMLFAMNEQGVPSEAKIVQITPEGYQIEQIASSETKMNDTNSMNHNAMNHNA